MCSHTHTQLVCPYVCTYINIYIYIYINIDINIDININIHSERKAVREKFKRLTYWSWFSIVVSGVHYLCVLLVAVACRRMDSSLYEVSRYCMFNVC